MEACGLLSLYTCHAICESRSPQLLRVLSALRHKATSNEKQSII